MDSKDRKAHTSTSPDNSLPSSRSVLEIGKDALFQPTISGPVTLFSLPGDIRENIYRRVLVVAHPVFLFQDTGAQGVETFAPERPFRWLALLYTNRRIYDEARRVLYRFNHFTFMDTTQHQGNLLQSFFNCIGSINAGHLSHLSINFPVVESAEDRPGVVMLKDDDLYSLKLLQENCISLVRLETIISGRKYTRLINPGHDDSQFVHAALSQIDAQFRAVPLLNEIIVRYYDGPPAPSVIELMQSLGWGVLRGK